MKQFSKNLQELFCLHHYQFQLEQSGAMWFQNSIVIFNFSIKQAPLRLPSFSHFPLHPSIFNYLEASSIHTPTFVQYALLASLSKHPTSIHHITSPTGSGKTLAYLIPICSALKKQQQGIGALTASRRPRGLVLTASKELVLQAKNVGKQLSHHCKLKVEGLGIGKSLNEEDKSLQGGVDILFASYQRIHSLLDKQSLYLSHLKWVVVDEIDTLYDTGKLFPILDNLLKRSVNSPQEKAIQVILSGTTRPKQLQQYLKHSLGQVRQVVDKNTHLNLQNIKHEFVQCQSLDKHDTLYQVLSQRPGVKTLIFCTTIRSLHELAYYLEERKIQSVTLHSELHKQARIKNYELFRDGQASLLLSTDLGARGLDIPHLDRVINYDFPLTTCDYLQRAGRTGRAGKEGQVVTLYHKKNLSIIDQLRSASFSRPLSINASAYRMKNRQQKRK